MNYIRYLGNKSRYSERIYELLYPKIKGSIFIEPFGGSGSTLIACLKLGRKCRIMEKSPVYTEVIIKRWEKHTGKKAIKIN